MTDKKNMQRDTLTTHAGRDPQRYAGLVNTPVFRGSTVLFPDVESAERALAEPASLHIRTAHMALTDRAFERTPAARLGNRPVTDLEREPYQKWIESDGEASDRSALLMLGLR